MRAGLWEQECRLTRFGNINYAKIQSLAQEQSVVGLVTAGLEHVVDIKIQQEYLLLLIGETLQIEQRNKAMNSFLSVLIKKMRGEGISSLLVKGQGVAQCYERPQWRASGDIDLLLSEDNYLRAKDYLLSLSSSNKPERKYSKELGMSIGSWYVEIHGTQRTGLSTRVDKVIDDVLTDVFREDKLRSWQNGDTQIFLSSPDSDVFFVFTHFIKHFYKEGGVSIRQLCDWCRLLWTFKEKINIELLENRLNRAGLLGEWKGFASVAVEYLGMPCEAMPLFSLERKWKTKAQKIITFILKGGEWKKVKDTITVAKIYPCNTIRFLPGILFGVNWLKIKERLIK